MPRAPTHKYHAFHFSPWQRRRLPPWHLKRRDCHYLQKRTTLDPILGARALCSWACICASAAAAPWTNTPIQTVNHRSSAGPQEKGGLIYLITAIKRLSSPQTSDRATKGEEVSLTTWVLIAEFRKVIFCDISANPEICPLTGGRRLPRPAPI